MDDPEQFPVVISQQQMASLVVRLARAVEQTTALLEAATNVHRDLAELDAALTESLVDLEGLLEEAQQETPRNQG